jgi:hypothetical protein
MDPSTLDLTLFLAATFLAALVAGLAGFAFGLVAAAAWLHVLTPVQTASLIVAFGPVLPCILCAVSILFSAAGRLDPNNFVLVGS